MPSSPSHNPTTNQNNDNPTRTHPVELLDSTPLMPGLMPFTATNLALHNTQLPREIDWRARIQRWLDNGPAELPEPEYSSWADVVRETMADADAQAGGEALARRFVRWESLGSTDDDLPDGIQLSLAGGVQELRVDVSERSRAAEG